MKRMLKFSLVAGDNFLTMPGGLSHGAHVDRQAGSVGELQLWNLVDDTRPDRTEHVFVCCTGDELPEGFDYFNLGTVLINGGGGVVHALLATKV